MAGKIRLRAKEKNIGERDTHYIDENDNKIATLFRSACGKRFTIFFYPEDLKHIIINNISSHMQGYAAVEKTLVSNGYDVLNKMFHSKPPPDELKTT